MIVKSFARQKSSEDIINDGDLWEVGNYFVSEADIPRCDIFFVGKKQFHLQILVFFAQDHLYER